MTRTAVYAGSFDPLHLGHIDTVERGAPLFDRLVICVARNVNKRPLFSLDARLEMIRETFAAIETVEVEAFDGLLVEFARRLGACALLRGVRTHADLDLEMQLANMNRAMVPTIETVILLTDPRYAHLSSSLIKEVASLGGPLDGAVSPPIQQRLIAAYHDRSAS